MNKAVMIFGAILAGCGGEPPSIAHEGSAKLSSWIVSGNVALPEACQDRRSEDFPQVVADPSHPEHLSVVYYQDGTRAAVGATSRDGGRHWQRAPISAATACAGGPPGRTMVLNPLISQGSQGRIHYGASFGGSTAVFAADDASGAWSTGVSPDGGAASENMNTLPDPFQPGRVHAIWTHFQSVPVVGLPVVSELRTAMSLDGAASFSRPSRVAPAPLGRLIINARVARTSERLILACYDSIALQDLPNAVTNARTSFQVNCVRSADGASWSAPVDAGSSVFLPLADPEGRDTPGADSAFITVSAKFDLASGPDGFAVLVHADREADGRGRLSLMRSFDDGRTWSGPQDAIVRANAVFQPAIAVGQDGTIGIFWYDWSRDVPGDDALSTDAWLATSADGGTSWSVQHLAGPFDLRAAYQEGLSYDGGALGAYQDLVALPDGFGAVFTVGPPLAQDGKTDVVFARVRNP